MSKEKDKVEYVYHYEKTMEGATLNDIAEYILGVYDEADTVLLNIIIDEKADLLWKITIVRVGGCTLSFRTNLVCSDLYVGEYCDKYNFRDIDLDLVHRHLKRAIDINAAWNPDHVIGFVPMTETVDLIEDPSEIAFDEPVSATDCNDIMVKSIVPIIYPYQLYRIFSKMMGKLDNPLHNGWHMGIQHGPVRLSFIGTREGNKYTIACSISHDEETWQNTISFIVDDNGMHYYMDDITNMCVMLYKSVLCANTVNVDSYQKTKLVFNNRYGLHQRSKKHRRIGG